MKPLDLMGEDYMFGYLDGYEGRRMNADRSIDYEEGWTQGMFDYNFGRVCLYGTK